MADAHGLVPGTYNVVNVWDAKRHRNQRRFVCRSCGVAKDRPARLQEHMQQKHPATAESSSESFNEDSGAPSKDGTHRSASPTDEGSVDDSVAHPSPDLATDTTLSRTPSDTSKDMATSDDPSPHPVLSEQIYHHLARQYDVDEMTLLQNDVVHLKAVLREERIVHEREIRVLQQRHRQDLEDVQHKHNEEMQVLDQMHKTLEEALATEIVRLKKRLDIV